MVKRKQGLAGKVSRRPLRLGFWLAGLAANPFESPCGDQAHDQKVVTTKAGGVFPSVSILIGPLEGHVEHGTFVGVLRPDAGADGAVTEFVDRLSAGITDWCLIFHGLFFCWFNSEERKCGGACWHGRRPGGIASFQGAVGRGSQPWCEEARDRRSVIDGGPLHLRGQVTEWQAGKKG